LNRWICGIEDGGAREKLKEGMHRWKIKGLKGQIEATGRRRRGRREERKMARKNKRWAMDDG
tara:strand:+ start:394 stop:579 length:186 start_codon:yes stop_codon:yes gene_type:complete